MSVAPAIMDHSPSPSPSPTDRGRIIVALDFTREHDVLRLLDQLDPRRCRVKVGKELFAARGPELVDKIQRRGFEVFLDLKFHDIPNTVSRAVRAVAVELGVWMLNVHAAGGRAMLEAARAALADAGESRPRLLGVTVLTSLSDSDLAATGLNCSVREQVSRLARLSCDTGLDGVVCSPAEVALLRAELPAEFLLVTPGVRRAEDAGGDQKRIMGPAEAVAAGADYLVVGRPITRAADPAAVLADYFSKIHGIAPNPY